MDVEEQGRAVSVFGSKVFRDLLHHGATHNVVLSPLALGMALMAATAGASGETKKELLDMFQITTLDLESCQSLIRGTTKSHSVLDIATSLWFDKSYELKKEFITTCEENFYTTVKNLSDAEDINRWVTSATHGKLRRVIDPLPQSQPLTVVNCVYFHGTWKKEFTTDPNLKIKFTGFDGTTKESEAMKVTASLPYIKNDLYQAVEIPYCDRFVATVIVPERDGEREIQDIVDRLREFTSWRKFTEQLSSQSVTVSLPQFKIEWQNYHLEEACKDLGLRTCFSSVASTFADASVNHEGLYISQILHRTLIEVGARGMETTTLSDPDSATSLVVDRPFIFVISDTKSGSVLVSSVVDQFSRFSDDDVDGSGQTTTTTNVEMSETKTRREVSRSPRRKSRSKSRSRSRSRSPRRRSPSPRRRRSRSPARSYRSRSRSRSTSRSRRRHSRSPRRGGRYRSRSPRRYRSPRGRRNRSPSPRRPRETTCLFVRNFSSSVTKRELTDLFSSCGDLKNVYIAVNKERAPYAFVTFYDRLDAEDAMDKYNGHDLDGKKLCLDWDVGIENKRKKSNSNYVKY